MFKRGWILLRLRVFHLYYYQFLLRGFFPEDQPLLTETEEEKTSLNISIYI